MRGFLSNLDLRVIDDKIVDVIVVYDVCYDFTLKMKLQDLILHQDFQWTQFQVYSDLSKVNDDYLKER